MSIFLHITMKDHQKIKQKTFANDQTCYMVLKIVLVKNEKIVTYSEVYITNYGLFDCWSIADVTGNSYSSIKHRTVNSL